MDASRLRPVTRERTATLLAAALLTAAVVLAAVVGSGTLGRDASSARAPGASAAAPVPSGTAARRRTLLHVGGRGCDDRRSAGAAARRATPWCTLGRALAAAPPRSTVLVAPGRYRALRSSRPRRLGLVVRAADPRRPPRVAGVVLANASGLRLSRLRFTRGVSLTDVDDVMLDANAFARSTLFVRGGHRVRVLGNRLGHLRGERRAILLQGAVRAGERTTEDVVVQGNRIDDIRHDGIDVYHGYRRVTIAANHITRVRQPPGVAFHTDAIQLTGGEGLVLRGNRVEGVTHGIIIKDERPTTGARITGNVVAGVDGASLQLFNAPGALLEHNTFWDNQVSLVLDDDPRVAGRTSAVLEGNVLQQLVARHGSVARAAGNVFRYGSGVGKPAFRGLPRLRDPAAGDFRLQAADPGLGIPAGADLPGTRLGPRP